MKHPKVVVFLAITVLAALVLGTTGCEEPGAPKVYRNPASPVYVNINEEFVIALEANHTTGFSWQLAEAFDEGILQLVSNEYEAPKSDLMGAPGEEMWTFKATGEGRTYLHFAYAQPWETGAGTHAEGQAEAGSATETGHSATTEATTPAATAAAEAVEQEAENETMTFTVDVGPSGSTTKAATQYKEDAAGNPIEAPLGSQFALVLESNPTTGYRWQLAEPLDGTMLILVSQEYQQAKAEAGKEPATGAGGEEVWTFRTVGEGETEISLKYVRSWEAGSPTDTTVTFTVNITKEAKEDVKE